MSHMIFAPTGTLKRRSMKYMQTHAALCQREPISQEATKQQRKQQRRNDFVKTGDTNG